MPILSSLGDPINVRADSCFRLEREGMVTDGMMPVIDHGLNRLIETSQRVCY